VGENRLTEPLVRRDGCLKPASWEIALSRAAETLTAAQSAAGPDGLAFLGAPHCTNEENYLLQKIARVLGTNNVDNRSRLCHASAARVLEERLGWPATTSSLDQLSETDLLIVAGANPAERQPVAFNSFVRPAVNDGMALIHVDPVGNRTTRLADYHVAPRPGRDGTVFDVLSAQLLATADGINQTFIANRTRGFDRFRESIVEIDREGATTAAGVDRDTMRRVADELVTADRIAAMVGTGIESRGMDGPAALLDLLLLNGGVGRPGTGLFILRGLANEQGAADAGSVPEYLPGYQSVTDEAARDSVAAEWGVTPPSTPGKNVRELLAAFGEGIHGALIVGENPAISKREREWLQRRLDSLEALVAVDIMHNGTTEHADVVLPAAAGVEKSGSFTNLERRVQRFSVARTPPGDARPDLDILIELGRRLSSTPSAFDYDGPAAVFDELTRVAPTHTGVEYAGIDAGGAQWPIETDGQLYEDTFDTADGLATFGTARPVTADTRADELTLVTGGRRTEFSDTDSAPAVLRVAEPDATERGIRSGDQVVVTDGETELTVTAEIHDEIRAGTVYLPATAADPLLRSSRSTVSVRPE